MCGDVSVNDRHIRFTEKKVTEKKVTEKKAVQEHNYLNVGSSAGVPYSVNRLSENLMELRFAKRAVRPTRPTCEIRNDAPLPSVLPGVAHQSNIDGGRPIGRGIGCCEFFRHFRVDQDQLPQTGKLQFS